MPPAAQPVGDAGHPGRTGGGSNGGTLEETAAVDFSRSRVSHWVLVQIFLLESRL
jgi:hypothetical protein